MEPSKYQRIKEFLERRGEPSYRYRQVLHAVFKERTPAFGDMTTLPGSLAKALEAEFGPSVLSLSLLEEQASPQATKVLFALDDGQRIETVHMRFRAGWHSYCVSSQVGCGFKCAFCATGTIGLKRNLTVGEITDQILYFHLRGEPIDSISFMGMGEALANQSTFAALGVLHDHQLFDVGARRISVSTIGLPRGIRRLTEEFPQVNLTLSVHSPFDEQRSRLMPINESHPLAGVLDEVDRHVATTNRKVYFAYVLLKDVNDSPEHARSLAELVLARPHPPGLYHVNLIRYNPAQNVGENYAGADEARINEFFTILKSAGVHTTLRQSFGVEIDAACGQLYGKYAQRRLSAARR
jgi:23S rRNA (adenine-C8)-methyltransferase